MTDVATIRPRPRVPTAALVSYILITFTITWSIAGLYIFRPEQAVAWFGEIAGTHPLYIIATWAPAFAAFAVVGFFGGGAGLKTYLTRLALRQDSPMVPRRSRRDGRGRRSSPGLPPAECFAETALAAVVPCYTASDVLPMPLLESLVGIYGATVGTASGAETLRGFLQNRVGLHDLLTRIVSDTFDHHLPRLSHLCLSGPPRFDQDKFSALLEHEPFTATTPDELRAALIPILDKSVDRDASIRDSSDFTPVYESIITSRLLKNAKQLRPRL